MVGRRTLGFKGRKKRTMVRRTRRLENTRNIKPILHRVSELPKKKTMLRVLAGCKTNDLKDKCRTVCRKSTARQPCCAFSRAANFALQSPYSAPFVENNMGKKPMLRVLAGCKKRFTRTLCHTYCRKYSKAARCSASSSPPLPSTMMISTVLTTTHPYAS